MKKLIPSNYKKEIQLLLEKGLRPFEIAEKLNLNKISVSSYTTQKLGLSFSRTYNIDKPDYFKVIDSHMKAYWLGFICADGYLVNNPSKVIGIQITESDKCVLEAFKTAIGSDMPLRHIKKRKLKVKDKIYTSKPCSRLHIGNKQMFDDLVNLGLTENKSKTLSNILDNIDYQYRDAFIVGYSDGDGSVLLPSPNGKVKPSTGVLYPSHSVHVNMRGTEDLLTGIHKHLELSNNITFHKTHILHISSKKDIIRYLSCYNNLNFFLERKFNKLISRLNHHSFNKLIQVQTISSSFPHLEN